MRRQIVKEPHLVAHIQVLDRLADFVNRAHAGNLSKLSAIDQPSCNPTTAWRGSRRRRKAEGERLYRCNREFTS
jgi:hypothetical protein